MREQAPGIVDTVLGRLEGMTPRDRFIYGGTGLAGIAALVAALSVIEERPAFPLIKDDAQALLDLHAQVPERSSANTLERFAEEERRDFFDNLPRSCPGGRQPDDHSYWYNHVEATGDASRPYRIVLDNHTTGVGCPGGPVWTVAGTPDKGYHFETPRILSFGNWTVIIPENSPLSFAEPSNGNGANNLVESK